MEAAEPDLLTAFAEDHRLLGKGFYELSQCLRGGDLAGARAAARLDRAAGGHIAFEEEHFYPRLAVLLGEEEVRRLLAEHGLGLEAVERLCSLPGDAVLSGAERARLLEESERMEAHIAECGGLFAALGRIPDEERRALRRQLLAWRRRHPTWRDYARTHGVRRSGQ